MQQNQFFTIDDLWRETLRSIREQGQLTDSRVGTTRELLGFSATLSNIDSTFLMNSRRKLSPHYACAEFLWYLNSNPNISMISAYAPQYVKFAEGDRAYGAYGYRLYSNLWGRDATPCCNTNGSSQLDEIVRVLTKSPDSRQAVLTLWEANDLVHAVLGDHKDLPCTMSMQFLIRNDKLHLIVTMRSNDAWLGLPYDVFAFTCIQRIIAMSIGIECGSYTHQAGSEHLYQKNWAAANEAVECNLRPEQRRLQHGWDTQCCAGMDNAVFTAKEIEREARVGNLAAVEANGEMLRRLTANRSNVLYDAAMTCANKWDVLMQPESPILRDAIARS